MVGERVTLHVRTVGAHERASIRVEAPSLLVTIESSVVRVHRGAAELLVDRSGCLLLPAGSRADLRAATPARVAVLSFHERLVGHVARTYRKLGLDRARLERWTARLEVLPRTVWVHEIVHRYVFERYALGEHDNAATRFLETEILKEVYFLFRDREKGADRSSTLRRYSAAVERAIAHIEGNLFETASVRALVDVAGASESTLLRTFQRELGESPAAYWRHRKLDEALVLLRSGRHSVAEVATRIGYDNPTSFGASFRRRFGASPSTFIPRQPTRRAP
jgi:AraC-like DNA-binding protein